jgi:SARP family transcriptional regulator, regulator of embCAB operon
LVSVRVYLTGTVGVQRGSMLVQQRAFPGPQGRVVFAMLAAEHGVPVSRDQLAEEIWNGSPPAEWEVAVRALVSKVRGLLDPVAGHPGQALITAAFGCYQLSLPHGAWVDLHAAAGAAHAAETALGAGLLDAAGAEALVASMISRRPFLAGVEGPWTRERRRRLQDVRIRALECLSEVWRRKGDHGQAARDAETVLGLDPYRETAYLRLMLAHAAAGNRASALLAYERCRAPPGRGPGRLPEPGAAGAAPGAAPGALIWLSP